MEKVDNTGGTESLQSFDWDNNESTDFFGIAAKKHDEGDNTSKTINQILEEDQEDKEEEETPPTKKPSKSKKEDVEEDEEEEKEPKVKAPKNNEFFSETEDEEDEEESKSTYTGLIKEAVTGGIFEHVTLAEGEELDKDTFLDKIDEEVEARIEEGFQGFMEDLSDDGKAFLKFAKNGGSMAQFIAAYSNTVSMPEVDIDNELDQKTFLRYYYRNIEGLDSEDVEDKIEWLEEKNKTSAFAKKYYEKVKAEDEEAKEELIESQRTRKEAQQKASQAFVTSLKKTLEEKNKIGAFTFSKKDKALIDYISKPTVKVGKNRYITEVQAEIGKVFQDPEKLLVLAKLVKSGFDISDIETSVKTEITKKARTNLAQMKENNGAKPTSSGVKKGKSLADMF